MTIFWKISHYLYKKDCKLLLPLDRAFEFINYLIGSNAISAKADIGKGTKFWHRGLGCTVHYKATIGDNCWILPNVMIGSKFEKGIPDEKSPIIGDNVFIGTGAVVIGNITVGDNVIIGANAVVTKDIPSNSIALGVPAIFYPRKTNLETTN